MEKVGLNITQKEFKQLSKWAEEVYNIADIVDYFLSHNKTERQMLATIVEWFSFL
jgi:hypothetical protein